MYFFSTRFIIIKMFVTFLYVTRFFSSLLKEYFLIPIISMFYFFVFLSILCFVTILSYYYCKSHHTLSLIHFVVFYNWNFEA